MKQTKEPTSLYYNISQTSINPLLQVHFQDFPGGYIESEGTKEEIQKVEKFLEESCAVIIPIDAAALMEREGKWHEKTNQPTVITNLLKKAYQNLNSPRLVILVPVKCETYMQEPNSEQKLLNQVKEKYSELLDFLRTPNSATYVSVVVTPVQTVGNLKFSRIEGEDEEEPKFYFRQTERNVAYAPKDAEQPLQYLFSFCLKLHAEQKLFPGINFINNLAGIDNPFRQAALQVARGRKRTGGFAVLQGQNWLDI
ncbi:hypothetical protein CAL7716_063360 [Calothrix sp. PCC 7716]|nr:hypothetical protein CAL7716_063360 [Calothrix sp. PCC 7716]